MTSFVSRLVLSASVLACSSVLGACDDGGSTYTLSSGAKVEVGSGGGLRVRVGARTILETASGEAFTARAFEQSVDQVNGFYGFLRGEEEVFPLRRFRGSSQDGDSVRLRYDDGNGHEATVRIGPGPVAGTTKLEIRVSGVDGLGSTALPLRCEPESSYLGFGAQYNGTNQRGETFALFTEEQGIGRTGSFFGLTGDAHSTYLPMPYFLDARGFGMAIDTAARVKVDLCATDPDVAWFEVEHGVPVDVLLFHGPTPRDVVRQVGDIYGRPKVIPDWTFGPWISIQGGQTAVLAEADALDAEQVPYTALWAQDWVGLRDFLPGLSGVKYRWVPDTTLYPDLAAMTANLHARGKRFLGYANPFVQETLDHWNDMSSAGTLIHDATGQPYRFTGPAGDTNGKASLPDLTNPAARTYVAGFLETMVSTYGFDGWMCDFAEWLPTDAVLHDGSDPMLQHNLYPAQWHGLHREVLERLRPGNDFALFSRSGWLGTQGTAQIVWIGDQETDWTEEDGLPTVVPAMLNLGLSGVPYVTHDIGGFSTLPAQTPRTKELFLRWTELGAFTTIMRTHEGLKRAVNWDWNSDAETIAHFRRFGRIHEALVPLFHELVAEAATTSLPPLRHLVLVFPDDPEVVSISDQFMVGDELLVAPVVEEGATSREVYLPAGTWYHALTGEAFEGGRRVEVDAPLGTPPVFWRDSPNALLMQDL